MACASPRVFAPLALFVLVLAACSPSGSRVGSAGSTQHPFIKIDTSSLFVTVENDAGRALMDVQLTVKPTGGMLVFTDRISRLESNEKHDISISDFKSRDGTPLNLRVYRPREVTVTAVDLVGEKFEMTKPWN